MGKCKSCTESVFKAISSYPDFSDFLKVIQDTQSGQVVVDTDTPDFVSIRETNINNTTTYYVNVAPYIPLQISSFTLVQAGLRLKGTTVTNLNFAWAYNKAVETQSISGGISAPTPTSALSYSLDLTDLNITTTNSYTLTADDETTDANPAITSPTRTITFGNYIYQTQIAITDRANIVSGDITSLDLTLLPQTLIANRNLTFTALSEAGEYEVLLVPNSFGLTSGNEFKNNGNNFTGGWSKLFDVSLTNEAGFTESYGCWVSTNKNLNGSSFTIL